MTYRPTTTGLPLVAPYDHILSEAALQGDVTVLDGCVSGHVLLPIAKLGQAPAQTKAKF